jgi:hypothetical protein
MPPNPMTRLLEEAFKAAAKLSAAEQDALAQAILAEVAAESQWDRRLAETSGELERLADEALREHRRGLTRPLAPDEE